MADDVKWFTDLRHQQQFLNPTATATSAFRPKVSNIVARMRTLSDDRKNYTRQDLLDHLPADIIAVHAIVFNGSTAMERFAQKRGRPFRTQIE